MAANEAFTAAICGFASAGNPNVGAVKTAEKAAIKALCSFIEDPQGQVLSARGDEVSV
jgi:hypothetical protein